jgi:AraC family transcriptional regulator of adaptative response / DNA-3-methyladenine glycosylase II
VERALKLIDEGALDGDGTVEALATRCGVGARHLTRLFRQHLGASPIEVAQTRRVQRAMQMIAHTQMPMTEIAHAAGFASVRRFNEVISARYGRPPSELCKVRPHNVT